MALGAKGDAAWLGEATQARRSSATEWGRLDVSIVRGAGYGADIVPSAVYQMLEEREKAG